MKKHIIVVLALAAISAVGLYTLADDPPLDNKAPPLDSKIVAAEQKGNTGEEMPQPSSGGGPATSNSDAEFNEPSRSPGEIYTRMDPAFAKYVDLSLLVEAMAGPDASLLVDVALGLAEGERVLVRKHRAGLAADLLMGKAAKLAVQRGDKATQDRIASAATVHNKPQWSKLLTEAKDFGSTSRDGPMITLGKIDSRTVALVENVRRACDLVGLTGDITELNALKTVAAAEVDAKVKTHLTDLLDGTLKGLPAKADETTTILQEFAAASRDWIPGKTIQKIREGDLVGAMSGVDIRIPANHTEFVDTRDYSYWITIKLVNVSGWNVAMRFSGGVAPSNLASKHMYPKLTIKSEGHTARTPWVQLMQPDGNWGTRWNLEDNGEFIITYAANRPERLMVFLKSPAPVVPAYEYKVWIYNQTRKSVNYMMSFGGDRWEHYSVQPGSNGRWHAITSNNPEFSIRFDSSSFPGHQAKRYRLTPNSSYYFGPATLSSIDLYRK